MLRVGGSTDLGTGTGVSQQIKENVKKASLGAWCQEWGDCLRSEKQRVAGVWRG